jgi:hypothetical protein
MTSTKERKESETNQESALGLIRNPCLDSTNHEKEGDSSERLRRDLESLALKLRTLYGNSFPEVAVLAKKTGKSFFRS